LKQFAELTPGVRLVDRAVATAQAVAPWVGLIVPPGHVWDRLTGPKPPVDQCCDGGSSRCQSIAAGLAMVPIDFDVVLIHSASSPLASVATARRALEAVGAGAAGAVPTLALVDVAKRVGADGALLTVGREGLGLAQSPMAFERAVLGRAFAQPAGEVEATEESQLVEALGATVVAVDGQVDNVHVVDQTTLTMVQALAAHALRL